MATENIEQDEVIVDEVDQDEELNEISDDEKSEEKSEESSEATDDSVIVSIGDDPVQQEDEDKAAPEWVRNLRKEHRALQKEKRDLENKLKEATQEVKPATLGKEPELEDFDYDTDKFKKALTSWYDKKRAVDDEAAKARAEQENQQKAWQERLGTYHKLKTELKVPDFDDAEATVRESLSETQQGIIVQGAKNPALVVFALGKNEKKLKELSEVKDPVKFAFACAELEQQLKITQRKAPPPPEKTISGAAKSSGGVDNTLERLRADAEKTGDMSKVIAYKRQKKTA